MTTSRPLSRPWRRRIAWAMAGLALLLAALWVASAFFVVDVGLVAWERRLRARCDAGAYLVEIEHWTAADELATGSITRWANVGRPWSGGPRGPGDPGPPRWTWCLDASWHHTGVRVEWLGAPFSPQQPDSLAAAGWWPVLIAGSAALWLWHGDRRSRRRAASNKCPRCGYDLAGLAVGSPCPECGHVAPVVSSPAPHGRSS